MEDGAFIGFRAGFQPSGRAMEPGMGNALLHVYHPSFALRNDMAYERRPFQMGLMCKLYALKERNGEDDRRRCKSMLAGAGSECHPIN